jgi:hypothetical protein
MYFMEFTMRHVGLKPRAEIRAAIMRLQDALQTAPLRGSSEDAPVQHIFAPGTYCREITMAEGQVIVGRIHRHAHSNIISKGRCLVLTEWGFQELSAPCIFNSEVGTKRVVLVLEDTVWTTVHANPDNETDEAVLLARLSAEAYSDIEITGELV